MISDANTKSKVISLRSTNPYMKMSDIGRAVGVSKQRVYQILRKQGLPTKRSVELKYKCLVCGHSSSNKFCSKICKAKWQKIPIVCTNCGKLFFRDKERLLQHHREALFCCRKCFGIWAGEHHGFKRKWDYAVVWAAHLETGYGACRLSKKLNIPESSISEILRFYKKHS